jgi:hypothetical protein
MTWVLIILWSLAGHPMSTVAAFGDVDACNGALEKTVADLSSDVRIYSGGGALHRTWPAQVDAKVLSAECHVQSRPGVGK